MQTPDGVVVTFRPTIVLASTLFLFVWLAVWYVGERVALRFVMNPNVVGVAATTFVGLWVSLWTLAGIAVTLSLLWRGRWQRDGAGYWR